MTPRRQPPVPRWQDPALDEAALAAAHGIREAIGALRARGATRWVHWLEPLEPVLEDGDRADVLVAARRARAAFGAKDSVLDDWPDDAALRLRDVVDALLRALDARAMRGE